MKALWMILVLAAGCVEPVYADDGRVQSEFTVELTNSIALDPASYIAVCLESNAIVLAATPVIVTNYVTITNYVTVTNYIDHPTGSVFRSQGLEGPKPWGKQRRRR